MLKMIVENLSTLKIHKLKQEQYERELAAGNIDECAIYLTPDEEIDLSPYATIEQLNSKANSNHNHNMNDITNFPSSLPANGGNADTVDGKHANEFAATSDVEQLKLLVGDTNVSTQISNAIASKADSEHTHTTLTDPSSSSYKTALRWSGSVDKASDINGLCVWSTVDKDTYGYTVALRDAKPLPLREKLLIGYGDSLPSAGTAGRIFFKKV